ncbi:MAG: amidohydrolase family protein [Angelakisella sp.]
MRSWLKNGLIVDGTGAEPYMADVVLEDDRIAFVGTVPAHMDAKIVDLSGLLLCPAYIDVHAHSDISLLYRNNPCSKVLQGIGTEIIGNCGFSPFPLEKTPYAISRRRASLAFIDVEQVDWHWQDFRGYRAAVEAACPNTNLLPLVGHGSIRAAVMGYDARKPTAPELDRMCGLLEECLGQGAAGLSVGLGYPPDCYAFTEELLSLAQVVRRQNKILTLHMRNERTAVFDAVEEALALAVKSGVRMELSHLKCAGRGSAGRSGELLRRIEQGRKEGADVTFDIYPYCCGSTCLSAAFPDWAQEGGMEQLLQRLSTSVLLPDILGAVEKSYENFGDSVTVTLAEHTPWALGKTMAQLGQEWACTPAEAAVELMLREQGRVEVVTRLTTWEDLDTIALHPLCLYGTDGLAMDGGEQAIRSMPHPRYFGSMPALFGRYHTTGWLTMGELIHRLTLKPAERFGIRERGAVRRGWYADLAAIATEQFCCGADYLHPLVPAQGVKQLWIGGRETVSRGVLTGVTAGRVL